MQLGKEETVKYNSVLQVSGSAGLGDTLPLGKEGTQGAAELELEWILVKTVLSNLLISQVRKQKVRGHFLDQTG